MSVKELRTGIGCEILEEMEANVDLPLPNSHRLAKVMQEYYAKGDYAEELQSAGYKWKPTADYWHSHLARIRRELRKQGKFFEYARAEGEFRGMWQFVNKKEYYNALRRTAGGLKTRIDGDNGYNEKLADGQKRWKLELPIMAEVPELPHYKN